MSIVTELEKEFEKAPIFRAILDSLPEMIFIFDNKGRLTKVNAKVQIFLKQNKEIVFSDESGKEAECKLDVEIEDDNPLIRDCFIRNIVKEVKETKKAIYNRQGYLNIFLTNKTKKIKILLNALPFKFENDDYVIVTVRDVQNIKKYEEQHIKDMHKFSVIGESVSTIVHDLKNPLTGLAGYLELLKMTDSEEKKEIFYEKMEQGIDRLKTMLEDILNIAAGINDLILDKTYVNIKELFLDVINILNIEHLVKMEIDENIYLYGDRDKLHNVFWNILKNAEEALPHGEGEIKIKVVEYDKTVKIIISDTGKGIPEEIKDELFTLGATFGKSKGTGFGLASVKKIIDAHNGKIRFESIVDRGTTFYIRLPK
ncbi:MAG: hypothetical protein PWP46_1883 [Fusobacteriaceae bacterium]|jgi:signal transduction histidine kinase|nr:signal transduction histidine kinase [Fusobacteriales bacterium]MDN5304997.1 hypothetical protein [Fusobacteriaceae bacterium]